MQISKLVTLSNMKHLKAPTVFWVMSTLWSLTCYLSRLAAHSKFKINQVVRENEWNPRHCNSVPNVWNYSVKKETDTFTESAILPFQL